MVDDSSNAAGQEAVDEIIWVVTVPRNIVNPDDLWRTLGMFATRE